VLAAADCFALMAAGSDESCRAVLEAMAAARPVVARRVGALPETVRHGETGLLVDDDRPESVAAALLDILADPERARAMGRAARRHAETEFHPDRAAAITSAVYERLVAAAPGGDGATS
ncbi:MAG TPA: glycosyltransferase, partial [Candidatus Binatia bacterium]|nr:glycosyltransferase [Candidatus Binatia bacterium]